MDPTLDYFLSRICLPVVLAVLTTLLTVRLAFRRFKSETLWSRKLDAYTKILEALHYARLEADKNFENELRYAGMQNPPVYTPEYKAHLTEMKKAGYRARSEMEKILDTGTLIISPEATTFLNVALKPRHKDWENDSGVEFWETEEKNMREAINRINQIARNDLRV